MCRAVNNLGVQRSENVISVKHNTVIEIEQIMIRF